MSVVSRYGLCASEPELSVDGYTRGVVIIGISVLGVLGPMRALIRTLTRTFIR